MKARAASHRRDNREADRDDAAVSHGPGTQFEANDSTGLAFGAIMPD